MKNLSKVIFAVLVIFAITSQGFQCGSPEFSGAKLRISQKDYKGAIALLETEVQKNPTNEEAWYLLGGLKADQEDYTGMNTAFEQALKINNKHAKEIRTIRYGKWGQQINNGVSYLERASSDSSQYYDMAVSHLKIALFIWPDTALTYKYLGIAYYNKGDLDNALAAFQQSYEKGKDIESLSRVGNIYFRKGTDLEGKFESENANKIRVAKNIADIKKGSHKNDVMQAFGAPDNVKKLPQPKPQKGVPKTNTVKEEWTYNLVDSTKIAETWSYNRGTMVLVIEDQKVADKKFVKPYTPRIDSTYHRQATSQFEKAAQSFETIKSIDPKNNENLTFLLQAYVKADKIKAAIEAFRTAIINDPQNKNNHYILGILLRTDGAFQPAIDEFKAALAIDPDYSDASYDIGATLYNWGVDMLKEAVAKDDSSQAYKQKFRDALPFLEKVSSSKKDDPQVFETLATIYARLGQSDKAIKALDEGDWLRKHYALKFGMKEAELVSDMGQPSKKEDTTFENKPGSKWTYEKDAVSFFVVDGVVKDWTRVGK